MTTAGECSRALRGDARHGGSGMLCTAMAARPARTRFHVTLVRPDDFPAAEGLRNAAQALLYALRGCGLPAAMSVNTFVRDALNIVVGAHLLDGALAATLPPGTIIFNSEPLEHADTANALAPFAARYRVWDYHPRNLAVLEALGSPSPVLVVPGFLPELCRVRHRAAKDVDVLFYGQMSPHRAAVLEAVERRGHRVAWLHQVYGPERDEWLARARLVLNLHYRPGAPFEIARILYLLCNRCAVITEADHRDEVDADLAPGLALAPARDIPTVVTALLADEAAREALATRGFGAVRRRDFAASVRQALAACGAL